MIQNYTGSCKKFKHLVEPSRLKYYLSDIGRVEKNFPKIY